MTEIGEQARVAAAEGTAAASLLALATNMEVMKRLLGRRDADAALVPAEAALIRIAIDTARAEARRVGDMLSGLPEHPTSVHRASVVTMLAAVADLDAVLDALAEAVHGLSA